MCLRASYANWDFRRGCVFLSKNEGLKNVIRAFFITKPWYSLKLFNNLLVQIQQWKHQNIGEINSKLTVKTLEWCHWRLPGVFIVKLVFPLLTLNKKIPAGYFSSTHQTKQAQEIKLMLLRQTKRKLKNTKSKSKIIYYLIHFSLIANQNAVIIDFLQTTDKFEKTKLTMFRFTAWRYFINKKNISLFPKTWKQWVGVQQG